MKIYASCMYIFKEEKYEEKIISTVVNLYHGNVPGSMRIFQVRGSSQPVIRRKLRCIDRLDLGPCIQYPRNGDCFEMTGIDVDIIEIKSDDAEAKLTTAAASGSLDTLPDIVLMQDYSFQKFLSSYPEAFTDISDCGIDWSQFGELKQSFSMVGDKHYGVPFDNGAAVACWRVDVLEECGYSIEDMTDISWERLIEIGEDVYNKTGKYMMSGTSDSVVVITIMLQSCGANLFDEEGNAFIVGNEAVERATDLYIEMIEKNIYLPLNSWDEYIGSITKGNVVGVMQGNWMTGTIMTLEDQAGLWEVTNLPKMEGIEGATHYSNEGGSSWYITSNCKNVELAEKLLVESFGSSTDFYDAILPETGAISCYIPAAETEAYQAPQEFWNNQPVYAKIVEYSSQIPNCVQSPYLTEGRKALASAIQSIMTGVDKAEALKNAQAELEFKMQ